MTAQVADSLVEALNPKGVFVMVEAQHMCMTMRGIKKPGSLTITTTARGIYKDNQAERKEVLALIKEH
ncbi:GTP cyclohydrolase I [Streptococcus iniae]